jgi:hypothetical protein
MTELAPEVMQHNRAYADVKRVGRWRWEITLLVPVGSWPSMDCGTWYSWGSRERARRKSGRIVARYRRKHDRSRREHFVVRVDPADLEMASELDQAEADR